MARQPLAVGIIATQVVIPVELRSQRDHRVTIAALEGCSVHRDALCLREGIIHFWRRRVQERCYAGVKQDLRASASAAAPSETQCVQEAHAAETGAAIPQAKYRANGLIGPITGGL